MNATMDLNRVSAFVSVVESGSFTGAARALELPKSSVSRSVQHLEETLGVRLLQRTTRKLNLTDAGRVYYDQARVALAQLEDAGATVASMGVEPRGTVRVTAPHDLSAIVLPEIIADFSKQYPKVKFELSLSSRRVDLIEEGVDIAIRAGKLSDSSLIARRVAFTDLGLYASKRYLDRRGRPKRLQDLAEHDCVLFQAQSHHTTWRLSGPNGDEKVEVSGRLSVDDVAFVARALTADLGIGFVPVFLCAAIRELERVLPGYAVRGSELHVVMPSNRREPAAVALFREFLIARLSSFPWLEVGEVCAKAQRKPRRR